VRIAEVANLLMADLFRERPFRRPWTHDKGSRKPGVDLSPKAERAPRARLGNRMPADSEYVSLVFLYEGPSTTAIHARPICVRNQAGLILVAHRFRHSVANNVVHADVRTTSIQKLLGHRWIERTQTYFAATCQQVCANSYATCARIEVGV